jgi:hypothetical protein
MCVTVDLQIALHTFCVGTFMIYLITKLHPRLGKESEENYFHVRHIIFTLNKKYLYKNCVIFENLFPYLQGPIILSSALASPISEMCTSAILLLTDCGKLTCIKGWFLQIFCKNREPIKEL